MADYSEPSPLGRSLLVENGDLSFTPDKDLAAVRGLDNFLQGVAMIVETPYATDVFNTNYGLDVLGSLGGAHGIRVTKEIVRLNLVKSLSADSRVREVIDVVFDDDPRYATLAGGSGAVQLQKRQFVNPAEIRAKHRARRWDALVLLALIPDGEIVVRVQGESP